MGGTKNCLRRTGKNPAFWLFLLITVMFGVLFWRFVLGPYAYVYEDIGSDTFHINFPLYLMFSDFLHGEGYAAYVLRAGLGMDISSYLYQYINPLNLLVVAAPQRYLVWAVLFATYLKLLILGFAAFGLFRKLLKNDIAALAGACIWTFSGYVTLWGQHYGFCMSLMLFTVFLYLVYLFIEGQEKSRNWLLVPWITLMLFTNYYFLYTSGIVGAAFLLLYLSAKKERPERILQKLAGLAGMGILGICMGGVCLIPTLNIFLSSNRTSSTVNPLKAMLHPYGLRFWVTYVGRFFSNNTFGIQDYQATLNYYEDIMLCTDVLFLPGLVYLLRQKKTRIRTAVLLVLSLLMMAFPLTGQLLNLSLHSFRWSFFLCLLEAFVAGYFIREVLEGNSPENVKASMLIGGVLALAGFGFAAWGAHTCDMHFHWEYLALYAGFFLIFLILILSGRRLLGTRPGIFTGLLLGILGMELVVSSYPTINFRQALTRHQMNQERYSDGAQEAWELLKQQDPSVYRVGRNNGSYINDSMAQGYPGMSVYLATNSKEAVALKERYLGTGFSGNKIRFEENNYAMWMLLGMKYLISEPQETLPSEDYTYVGSAGGKDIYKNEKALPFGYFYEKCWTADRVEKMTSQQRIAAALEGFYFTEDTSSTEYAPAKKIKPEKRSLLDSKIKAYQCSAQRTKEGILLSDLGSRKKKEEDAYDPSAAFLDVGDLLDDGVLHYLNISMDPAYLTKPVDMAIYYATGGGQKFTRDRVIYFRMDPQHPKSWLLLPPGVTDLRVDVDTETEALLITKLEIVNYPSLRKAYKKLQASKVSNTAFAQNTYQAQVENTASKTLMFCVPFVYSRGWHAFLDGNPVTLYNINGGLCGLEVGPGEHEVVLRYEIPHEKAGILLSVSGLVLYVCIFLAVPIVTGKSKKSKKTLDESGVK